LNHGWDWRVQAGSNDSALAADFETRDRKLVAGRWQVRAERVVEGTSGLPWRRFAGTF
jgi:hypothetical protein